MQYGCIDYHPPPKRSVKRRFLLKTENTHEDRLAHEREILSTPDVAVVDTSHQDVGEADTDVLIDLEPKGVEQAVTADKVPVETPRE